MRVVLETLAFTILVPGTVTVAIPYYLLSPTASLSFRGPRLIGVFPIALGAVLYLWCAWDFAWTGRGTPAPIDPPRMLVARGLYRVVRNPMYIGVLFVLLGESIFFASPSILRYTLVVWLFFHVFVVLYEEPRLEKKFGSSYEEYCKGVPRWIPRLPRAQRKS